MMGGANMARITRRSVLKLSGAGVVAAKTGGLAAILATGRAPAYAQGTNIHWLRWADFVPASDVLLKGQITQECQRATGTTLCRRASPRQSNRELDPTSSCGDELIDLVVAALGAGDLVSHVTDLDEAFSVEPRPVAARHSSTLRRPCSAGAGLALAA